MTETSTRSEWTPFQKMVVMALLGFASGMPFMIIKDILKAWMSDAHVDLKTIGLFSAVSLPYTWKFVWSPLMDRYTIFGRTLGRRRGWMALTQAGLILLIATLGQMNPTTALWEMVVVCLAIAVFAASQDIVLDAFRREFLRDDQLAMGTGIWVNAYRGANLASVGVAFLLADKIGYANVHWVLAAMMALGFVTTLWVPEPENAFSPPRTLKEAIILPFREFLSRKGAWWVLAFVLLYKIGDNMAGAMNIPFLLERGYEKTEYFAVVKGLGMGALFGGMFLGGVIVTYLGVVRSLLFFGFLQAISTAAFALLATGEKDLVKLSAVVAFEMATSGMGATAYTTFMGLQTNKQFTATQYALLTSLMAVPGTVAASVTGFLASGLGWQGFYIFCTLVAVPGIFLIPVLAKQSGVDFGAKAPGQ